MAQQVCKTSCASPLIETNKHSINDKVMSSPLHFYGPIENRFMGCGIHRNLPHS